MLLRLEYDPHRFTCPCISSAQPLDPRYGEPKHHVVRGYSRPPCMSSEVLQIRANILNLGLDNPVGAF